MKSQDIVILLKLVSLLEQDEQGALQHNDEWSVREEDKTMRERGKAEDE